MLCIMSKDKDDPKPDEPSPEPEPPERTQCSNCGYWNGGGTCPRCGNPMWMLSEEIGFHRLLKFRLFYDRKTARWILHWPDGSGLTLDPDWLRSKLWPAK